MPEPWKGLTPEQAYRAGLRTGYIHGFAALADKLKIMSTAEVMRLFGRRGNEDSRTVDRQRP
jgi:hypothetical protein